MDGFECCIELGAPGMSTAHGMLGVYPVGGWWKRNKRKDRLDLPVRYSLIVSLKTRELGVDLYTPIATELQLPINIESI